MLKQPRDVAICNVALCNMCYKKKRSVLLLAIFMSISVHCPNTDEWKRKAPFADNQPCSLTTRLKPMGQHGFSRGPAGHLPVWKLLVTHGAVSRDREVRPIVTL